MNNKILLIYIEPTPYILDLINVLVLTWSGKIDVLFLDKNISQNWNIKLDSQWMELPKHMSDKIRFIVHLCRKNNYNFIHLAGWGHPLMLLFILIAKLRHIPISVESDTSIPHKTKLWKRIIKRLIYPPLFKQFNLFLPGGTRQAKYFEYYGVKSKYIIPVQMTVDISAIKQYIKSVSDTDRLNIRKSLGIQEHSMVYLYVGRLVPHKGIMDLLTAFNGIQQENNRLLIVGDGPMRQKIENAVKINKKILYAGRISGKELFEMYYVADVLVLPSHVEPWGLVVNEAMAMGLPVIVSDRVGCIDDLVIHQETGLVVKAACVVELQQAMEEMASAYQKRITMGKQSAKKITDWTLENEASKICCAWKQLVHT